MYAESTIEKSSDFDYQMHSYDHFSTSYTCNPHWNTVHYKLDYISSRLYINIPLASSILA